MSDLSGEIGKLGGSKRSARASRLPSFHGDGSSGSTPTPKTKAANPKPISMMSESDIKKYEGSMAHIGKGAGNTITLEQWSQKLGKVMPFLGAGLSYKAQIAAAEGVAGLLRNYLLEGVDPPLSGFTIGRRHDKMASTGAFPAQDHEDRSLGGMALASLAPHVKVNKPKQMRTRGAPPKNGKPGYPGVFAKGFQPCTISFDSEKYDRIAYVLEHGMLWKPPDKIRGRLMGQAIEGGFSPTEKNTTGYWEIPPRPFLFILAGPEAQRIVRQTAEAAMMGTLKKEILKRKEKYVDSMEHASVDVATFAETMASGDGEEDWTDLIQFKPRGRR